MSNERIERWSAEFNEVLKEQGLFVRDYDGRGKLQPYTAADALHRLLCTMDLKNGRPWLELTVRELVNLYGEAMELRTFHRIETDGARLRSLRARLDAAGGRDVELAEEIDRLEGDMTALDEGEARHEAEDLEEIERSSDREESARQAARIQELEEALLAVSVEVNGAL